MMRYFRKSFALAVLLLASQGLEASEVSLTRSNTTADLVATTSSTSPLSTTEKAQKELFDSPNQNCSAYQSRPGNPYFDYVSLRSVDRDIVRAATRPYLFDTFIAEAEEAGQVLPSRAAETQGRKSCLLLAWIHPVTGPRYLGDGRAYDWTERWLLRKQELEKRCEFDTVVLWAPSFRRDRLSPRRYTGIRQYGSFLARKLSVLLDDLWSDSGPAKICDTWDVVFEAVGTGGLAARAMFSRDSEIWQRAEDMKSVQLAHELLLGPRVHLRTTLFDNTPHAGIGVAAHQERHGLARWAGTLRTILSILPTFVTDRAMRIADLVELFHADEDRLLCRLAQAEKWNYNAASGTGTLLSFFDTVLFYGHLNENRKIIPQSALGIAHWRLEKCAAFRQLENEPRLQNRYFFMDPLASPMNSLAWNGDGNPQEAPLPIRLRSLIHDKNICGLARRSGLASVTQEILEVVNPRQQPKPLAPLRYAAFTNEELYRGPVHLWGSFLPKNDEINEGAAWVAETHKSVRSLQSARSQGTELSGDRFEKIVKGWWKCW